MAFKHGRFVWFELVTPSVDDGKGFWTAVAGFGTETMEMGGPPYLMLTGIGGKVGGVLEPRMPGLPPHFTSYLSVADLEATCAKVTANGGKVIVPPSDTPIGRFAVVADPQGATFQLWKGANGDDESASGVSWSELWARDAEQVVPFYERVFGLTSEPMDMPTGRYHVLKTADGTMAAGVMTSPDPKVPPMWLPYLEVDDVDAVVARVKQHGGAVHAEPMSMEGIGRFAIVADRQGATAGVIRSASR